MMSLHSGSAPNFAGGMRSPAKIMLLKLYCAHLAVSLQTLQARMMTW